MENLEIPKITTAQQMIDIISPIPAEKFVEDVFTDRKGKCCFLGHIHNHIAGNPHGDFQGYGARHLTYIFLAKVHGLQYSGVDVNNSPEVNGYTEPVIKDRLMHMLEDMVKHGY
jgi:hypothetical protein